MTATTRQGSSATKTQLRPTVIALCEGKTEAQYLNEWGRRLREKVIIRAYESEGVPLTLVKKAIRHQKKELRSGVDPSKLHVWCVADEDSHPNLTAALDLAKKSNIEFALSIPCIELWLVLHFQDQTAYIDRFDVQRICKGLIRCEKNLTTDALNHFIDEYGVARQRAINLEKKHEGDRSGPLANPQSSLWNLVDLLHSL